MAFTLGVGPVDAISTSSGTTVAVTLNSTTAGRSLICFVRWIHATAAIVDITCTSESNLTVHSSPARNASVGDNAKQCASLPLIANSGNKTVTVTFDTAITFKGLTVLEADGGDTADFFEAVSATTTGSSTNPTTSVDTTVDGSLIVAEATTNTGSVSTVGSGYTNYNQTDLDLDCFQYDLDAGAAGTISVPFVNAVSHPWLILAASFNPAPDPLDFSYTGTGGMKVGGAGTFDFGVPLTFTYTGTGGLAIGGTGSQTFTPMLGGSAFDLPVLTLSASGIQGVSGSAAFLLPAIIFAGAGFGGNAGVAEFNLPILTLEIAGHQNDNGEASFTLPMLTLSAAGATGRVGTATFALPLLTLSSAGYSLVTGVADFFLPALILSATGTQELADTFRTWVLNTRKNALTEYDFEFTSYAIFGNRVLAVSPAGVVQLASQEADGAADIAWKFRTSKADYGETHLKRVPRLYIGGKFTGNVLIRTIVDATGERTYRLVHNNVTGFQQRRVPIGKGPKARYWQYEVEGEDTATGTVENILAYPTGLRRRVM